MFVQRLQEFIEHPFTRATDAIAVTTGTVYVVPTMRAAIHEWAPFFADLAPYGVVVWLATQIICKIVVTHAQAFGGRRQDEDDE